MTKFVDGGDIDLDKDAVYLKDGTRLTEALAAEIGEDIAARRLRGRPSLTGRGKHSPKLGVRVSEEIHTRLVERATAEGKSLSEVARDALEAYV